MHHIAIMKKSWGLIPKILSGEKTIESRWYRNRSAPWGRIGAGETVYFKNSGEPVSLKATVRRVLQFEGLMPSRVRALLQQYGAADGISRRDLAKFYTLFKDKKYCILIFLKNPQLVPPFAVDKRGFGSMAAWLTLPRVRKLVGLVDV